MRSLQHFVAKRGSAKPEIGNRAKETHEILGYRKVARSSPTIGKNSIYAFETVVKRRKQFCA